MHKDCHNSTCDQYFSVKLAPLYLAHTELSIHAKNSILIKISQRSLFLEQVTYVEKLIFYLSVWYEVSSISNAEKASCHPLLLFHRSLYPMTVLHTTSTCISCMKDERSTLAKGSCCMSGFTLVSYYTNKLHH